MLKNRTPAWIRAVMSVVLGLGLVGGVFAAPAAATATTGVLEICKTATGPGVTGTFDFTVSGMSGTVTVPVGQCSAPITVTAGQVTVTEAAREGYQLAGITSNRLVSSNLAARTATVNVLVGDVANQTIVIFSNKTVEKGYLEVCKKAATGTTLGGSFAFNVVAGGTTYPVTVPVGGCSMPLALPAGNATITEAVRSDAELTDIGVTPADRLVSRNLAARSVTVTIVAGSLATQTIVTFTNKPVPQPKGQIKICKAATGVPAGTAFQFTLNGTALTVIAGSCSLPVEVAAGTAVVTEAAKTGYVVTAISVAPATALVSSSLANRTASVTVTAGQVTEVTFTNKVATGTLKVCKAAGPGVALGQVFSFTVAGQTVNVQAGSCSLPIEGLPIGNVTVDENVPSGYRVTAISVAGAGALVSQDLGAGTAVVSIAEGVTEVTFTNAHKPAVTGCVRTKGYYKNHPTVVSTLLAASGGTLLVGGVQLTAAQIDALYDRNSSNFLNQVTQQLITALLNQLSGASTPAAVQTAINAASLLIMQRGGPLTGTANPQTTVVYNGNTYTASQLVDVLSAYNEGSAAGGPPHCG